MKTIVQQLTFPFDIKDNKGNVIYYENSNGFWFRKEFDSNGNEIYYENSNGFWIKSKFDSNGNIIYYENSNGFWFRKEFDSKGNVIYYENSYGTVRDNRIKELTMDEIASKFDIPVEQLKIKKE